MSNAAGRATRRRLILTAERLFAERGIDVVPLIEIGEKAPHAMTATAQPSG